MTVKPPASSRVLTERRAIPSSPIQGLISNPHGSDQNGELHEARTHLFVCVCMQEDGDYVIVDEKLCSEEESKSKQVLLILILILVRR